MYPFARREKILSILRSDGQLSINRDASRLGVSTSTLHRDLEKLQKQGLIRKVRGGAIPVETVNISSHFDGRMQADQAEKKEIARRAVSYIQDDSSIFLDHSSTVVYLAKEIIKRQYHNLIIITNSLIIPEILADARGIQVIMTGGMVEVKFKALSGRLVLDNLRKFNLHQVFASAGAISLKMGLMTQMPFIHELLPEVFRCGRQVNILSASSKFSKIATFQVAPLDPSMRLFTDKGLDKSIRKAIAQRGIEIIY